MLEDLEVIDWSSLEQLSGDASSIPRALRLLTSESEEDRSKGYWKIDNHVVVQSDLFPAAPYVVPFLLEILAAERRPGAALVYDLLFEIGNGAAPESVTTDFRLPGWEEPSMSLQQACREAVKSGLSAYLQDVSQGDIAVRVKAVELVGMLADEDESIRKRLETTIAAEKDSEIRKILSKDTK